MRITRVFVTEGLAAKQSITLRAQAAHHIAKVLRLRAGAELTLFDGRGGEHRAQIATVKPNEIVVHVGAHVGDERESPLQITIVQGISRGSRMDYTVQKITELGATNFVPVITARSTVRFSDTRASKRREHWQRVAVSACEQCGRNTLPNIQTPTMLDHCLQSLPAGVSETRLLLTPDADSALPECVPCKTAFSILAGPEGGLERQEIDDARKAGFTPVRLGPRILRSETAAVTCLSIIQARWGDLH